MNDYPEPTERTLADLRSEFGADTIEHYKAVAQTLVDDLNASHRDAKYHADALKRSEQRHTNRDIVLKNFEDSIIDLIEEDAERVTWASLASPLELLGITVKRTWRADVTIKATVWIEAMTEAEAEKLLDSLSTYDVSIQNRSIEDTDIEEIDWSDLKPSTD